jgi:MoxR-like ATPase
MTAKRFASPALLASALRAEEYIADDGLAIAGFLAARLGMPLFLEGEPGVGKTEFAMALARANGATLVRLQCYEGIDAFQALYDWNLPRQLLRLKASGAADAAKTVPEADLYSQAYLIERPILRALRNPPAVLLIDEIDRSDDQFEALLLEFLSTFTVTIPELDEPIGSPTGEKPLVIITSNRTREVHDALKRRCMYHWIEHPRPDVELEILRLKAPDVSAAIGRQVVDVVQRLRSANLPAKMIKPPGVAEAINLAQAIHELTQPGIGAASAAYPVGMVAKTKSDRPIVEQALRRMVDEADRE